MTTNTPSIWDATFPTIPSYVIPSDAPSFTDVESVIDFVRNNVWAIEDNWTYAIRQRWVQWRLQIAQDSLSDERFRSETLRRAIQIAQQKLLTL